MATLASILSNELGLAVKAIQDNMDSTDFNASNSTKNSLTFEVSESGGAVRGIISGASSLIWAETGRGPRTSNESSGLSEKILSWMGYRGIGTDLSEKGKQGLANFITLRINKLGTKLWREGRTRDVYTKTLDKTVIRINEEMKDVISSYVTSQFKNALITT